MLKTSVASTLSVIIVLAAGAAHADPVAAIVTPQAPSVEPGVVAIQSKRIPRAALPDGIAAAAIDLAAKVSNAWTAHRADTGADPTLEGLVAKGYLAEAPKLPPRVIDLVLVSDIDPVAPGEQTGVILRTTEEICRYAQGAATGVRPDAVQLAVALPALSHGCFVADGEPIIFYRR